MPQTQFEAWLSFMRTSADGLVSADQAELRCTIVPLHNTPQGMIDALRQDWGACSTARTQGLHSPLR
jgi:hypothetical protein